MDAPWRGVTAWAIRVGSVALIAWTTLGPTSHAPRAVAADQQSTQQVSTPTVAPRYGTPTPTQTSPYIYGTPVPPYPGQTSAQTGQTNQYPGQPPPYPGQTTPYQGHATQYPGQTNQGQGLPYQGTSPGSGSAISGGAISGGTGPTPGLLPVGPSAVDGCYGDEQITFAPETPRVGNELLVVVSSSRPHPYGRLAGTEPTQFQRERTGQLGLVWEWIVRPTYPGKHAYTFYVDSTIPCKTIELTVKSALATATPKLPKVPAPFNPSGFQQR